MMNKLTILSVLLCTVSALTIPLILRDVAVPPVTEPTENTVWVVGTTQSVEWDISELPPRENISNPIGKVILGFLTDESYNLDVEFPLAEGFDILDGKVNITVPEVEPKDNYIVAVIGNSGNISPMFRIVPAGGVVVETTTSSSTDSRSSTYSSTESEVPDSTTTSDDAPESSTTEPLTESPPATEEDPATSDPADSEPQPTGASLSLRDRIGTFSPALSAVLGALILSLILH